MKFKKYLNTEELFEMTINKEENIGIMAQLSKTQSKKSNNQDEFKLLSDEGIVVGKIFQFLGMEHSGSSKEIKLGSGTSIFIKQDNKVFKITASKSFLTSTFLKASGGKSNTHKLTELKEYISALMFMKSYSEEQILKLTGKNKPDLFLLYKSEYYTSAVKQAQILKSLKLPTMVYELQGGVNSKLIYDTAKRAGIKGNPNNWNPADVWGFSRKGLSNLNDLSSIATVQELNDFLKSNYLSKDIIGISLKHVKEKNKAHIDVIDPSGTRKETDYSFKLAGVKIPENRSFKSIFFFTEANISLKGNMRGSSTTTCLNMEMYNHNKSSSLGSVPASEWDNLLKSSSAYTCKNISGASEDMLMESKKIFKVYGYKVQGDMNYDYDDLDDLTKERYVIVASMLKFLMTRTNQEEFIKECFYLSQKLIKTNSIYLKIS